MPELAPHQIALLLAAIAGVAFLYSSVGHGGATGYLAVLALAGIAPAVARPGALWINCVVAGIAFIRFRAAGHFSTRLFLLLAASSMPCAWLGSRLLLDSRLYSVVLGLALLAAGGLLARPHNALESEFVRLVHPWLALLVGAILGTLAGLTGIGGGVFLTPLLILVRWAPAKTAGGISAAFIVVNSVAGLIGTAENQTIWHPAYLIGASVGCAGALLGSRLGASRLRPPAFRRALALVLAIAGSKLLLLAWT